MQAVGYGGWGIVFDRFLCLYVSLPRLRYIGGRGIAFGRFLCLFPLYAHYTLATFHH